MLRDAFGQAFQAILRAISKDSSFSKVKDSDKRMNEFQSGLTGLVQMHGNQYWKNTGVIK